MYSRDQRFAEHIFRILHCRKIASQIVQKETVSSSGQTLPRPADHQPLDVGEVPLRSGRQVLYRIQRYLAFINRYLHESFAALDKRC